MPHRKDGMSRRERIELKHREWLSVRPVIKQAFYELKMQGWTTKRIYELMRAHEVFVRVMDLVIFTHELGLASYPHADKTKTREQRVREKVEKRLAWEKLKAGSRSKRKWKWYRTHAEGLPAETKHISGLDYWSRARTTKCDVIALFAGRRYEDEPLACVPEGSWNDEESGDGGWATESSSNWAVA